MNHIIKLNYIGIHFYKDKRFHLIQSESIYSSMWMMNCFSLYNPFPTDETLQAFFNSTAISMEKWSNMLHSVVLPALTLSAKTQHTLYIKAYQASLTQISSNQELLLCGKESQADAFLATSILTSSSLGLIVMIHIYLHKFHPLLIFSTLSCLV